MIVSSRARALLGFATLAVAFAAADTYVVVLALPDMMTSVGLSVDQLHHAAPIISGFLLGYIAILPLIGRISDVRGRAPVLTASLLTFAFGSLITALSTDLTGLVLGRFFQGIGAGGLVPATLALVADLYPVERRAVPLGVVSAVQEVGAVLGPLFGAAVLAVADWEVIFWINLGVGVALASGIVASTARTETVTPSVPQERPDYLGGLLCLFTFAGLVLVLSRPADLVDDVIWGWPFAPLTGGSGWLSPIALGTVALGLLTILRFVTARQPLIDLRGWYRSAAQADLIGAGLLALALTGLILAFATADPARSTMSGNASWWLGGSLIALVSLSVWLRYTPRPLVPRGALQHRPAWANLLANFFVGCALITALVEIPTYARITEYPDSQLGAALVLLRLLIAIPIGAVIGGLLTHRLPTGLVAAGAMVLVCIANVLFSQWTTDSLGSVAANLPLILAGLGFGLALAPLNSALLAATEVGVHGLASALAVVCRMVGMLVGVSVLTEIGLHQFSSASAALPLPTEICGQGLTRCAAYDAKLQAAVLSQVSVIFAGAAVCAIAAALAALIGSIRTNQVVTSGARG